MCVCVYKVILWLCCTRSIFFLLYVFLSTVLPPPTLCIAVCPHLTMHSAHYNCTNYTHIFYFLKKHLYAQSSSNQSSSKLAADDTLDSFTQILQSFFRQTIQIFHPKDVYRCNPSTFVWQMYVIWMNTKDVTVQFLFIYISPFWGDCELQCWGLKCLQSRRWTKENDNHRNECEDCRELLIINFFINGNCSV